MSTAEFDYQDFNTSAQQKLDEQLMVRFFHKPIQDKLKSQTEGRPIFSDREYIEIRIAGKRDPQACRPATSADKARFPRHYEAFVKRTESPLDGTPLSEWPMVSRGQVEELSFLSCKTVEQLAEMSDTHVSQIRGGYDLKQKAAQWLSSAEKSKVLAESEQQKKTIAEQGEMIKQLQEQMASMSTKPRGRKKVVDDNEE